MSALFDREDYLNQPIVLEKDLLLLLDTNVSLTIFEIGACEGEDSIKYARLFKNSRIFAFEPLPKNLQIIKDNISKYAINNISVFAGALSSKTGTADFYVSNGRPGGLPESDWDFGNKSSSLLVPGKHIEMVPFINFDDKITVNTTTLKTFCQDNHISFIDYVHMDVQGAELMVLNGAHDLINAIKVIWLEVSKIELYKNQPVAADVKKFMTANNFVLAKNCIDGIQGDQLYISKTYYPNYKTIIKEITKNTPKRKPRKSFNSFLRYRGLFKQGLKKIHKSIKKLIPEKLVEVTLVTGNYKLLIPASLTWAFSNNDYYEENVIYFLDRIIQSYTNPLVIDVGANCGYYSLRYAHLCNKIFAFEPVSKTYDILKKNIKKNSIKNIVSLKIGLSSINGLKKINLYNSSGNNSLFVRVVPEGHPLKKIGQENIELNSLDELVKAGKVGVPDVIKIDTEGSELEILKGAKNTITTHRPTILFEYSKSTSVDAGYSKEVLLQVLELTQYNIYGIPEKENDLTLIKEVDFADHNIANVIFVPKERDPFLNAVN